MVTRRQGLVGLPAGVIQYAPPTLTAVMITKWFAKTKCQVSQIRGNGRNSNIPSNEIRWFVNPNTYFSNPGVYFKSMTSRGVLQPGHSQVGDPPTWRPKLKKNEGKLRKMGENNKMRKKLGNVPLLPTRGWEFGYTPNKGSNGGEHCI